MGTHLGEPSFARLSPGGKLNPSVTSRRIRFRTYRVNGTVVLERLGLIPASMVLDASPRPRILVFCPSNRKKERAGHANSRSGKARFS
jgi:hypothetical protein